MSVRLYHGDCLEVMPTLDAGSVDCVIADLPYGTTACKWDSVIPFAPLWEAYKRLVKPNGAIVLFGSQPFTSALVMSNLKWFRYEWIWRKTNAVDFTMVKQRPRKIHENIVVFGKESPQYFPLMETGKPYIDRPRKRSNRIMDRTMPKLGIVNQGDRYPDSIQQFSNGNNNIQHPTQKPISLLTYLVLTYTNPGDTVLDNTMGSGTTGVACVQTGRNFIGIERDENYYCLAQKRIHEAQAQGVLDWTDTR